MTIKDIGKNIKKDIKVITKTKFKYKPVVKKSDVKLNLSSRFYGGERE